MTSTLKPPPWLAHTTANVVMIPSSPPKTRLLIYSDPVLNNEQGQKAKESKQKGGAE
jgi:hypothetical protein